VCSNRIVQGTQTDRNGATYSGKLQPSRKHNPLLRRLIRASTLRAPLNLLSHPTSRSMAGQQARWAGQYVRCCALPATAKSAPIYFMQELRQEHRSIASIVSSHLSAPSSNRHQPYPSFLSSQQHVQRSRWWVSRTAAAELVGLPALISPQRFVQ
jgi:hypothetical protein